ncbi:PAS domain S-box protein [Bacillus sp. ISL-47]|uniref:PAS domain S-box protein n=1 Tax=Bacillus sp. ISL-47 TaxID=2819130 RepID=UPI001BEAF395|nr:PAS domain S-box protein [Bacillus sp. ISL-47]MBT2690603.1 PAS domain S-box protein [Bacillus sp. ISL-47]MBT2708141.1 PAS domain S-box protein [Pseudomonas sp. ISL-84]
MQELSTGTIPDHARNELYRQIVENTFETTIVHSDYKVLYINNPGAEMLGAAKEDLIGAEVLDIFPDDAKIRIRERIRKALEENEIGALIDQTIVTSDGSSLEVELSCHPFPYGEKRAILSVLRDITDQKKTEREYKKRQNEVSTPIVPVMDEISIIPLVGTIDFDKAQILLETLPTKLKTETNVKHIIIDFSGIFNLDEVVVDFLIKIEAIMRLLGIQPIITGIRPELAQKALDNMGRSLHSIVTMKSVKQALTFLKR